MYKNKEMFRETSIKIISNYWHKSYTLYLLIKMIFTSRK